MAECVNCEETYRTLAQSVEAMGTEIRRHSDTVNDLRTAILELESYVRSLETKANAMADPDKLMEMAEKFMGNMSLPGMKF